MGTQNRIGLDLSLSLDIMGFVPQSDIMSPSLTVRECLEYHARMRLAKCDINKVDEIVNETMDLLGLTRVQHSLIGDENERGLSGGQKKRVNIGMELVSQPSVIFLDEPTSGLDSTTSNDVMGALRGIADCRGTNILCVIHQPRFVVCMCSSLCRSDRETE